MKTIKKNVYYCDFCKKKSLRSLKTHEKHCTANPDRECRLCEGQSIGPIIDKYKAYFEVKETKINEPLWETSNKIEVLYHKEFTLEDIINELDYVCPNCILAIIRCLGLNRFYFDKKYAFDYKKSLDEWWGEINKAAQEEDEWNSTYS